MKRKLGSFLLATIILAGNCSAAFAVECSTAETKNTTPATTVTVSGYQPMPMINIFNQDVYDSGVKWLTEEDKVRQTVADLNAQPDEDESIYEIAKNSVIIRTNSNYGYIGGYRIYMDSNDTAHNAIIRNDRLYVPLEFIGLGFKAATSYDETQNTITITGDKTLILATDSTQMTVDGETVTITNAPIIENTSLYIPVRAVAENLNKAVIYYNGAVVLTTQEIASKVTQEHLDTISAPEFMLDRNKILYPIDNSTMRFMVNNTFFKSIDGKRVADLTTEASTKEGAEGVIFDIPAEKSRYLDSTYIDLVKAIDEDLAITVSDDGTVTSTRNMSYKSTDKTVASVRPAFEKVAAFLANEYAETGDEDLALRIIIMAYHYAMRYDNLLRHDNSADFFKKYQLVAPMFTIYACDKIYHSPMWEVASKEYGTDIKKDLATWWTAIFDYLYANRSKSTVSNNENCLGHMAGIATVLDNPEMIHKVITRLDKAIEHFPYYADGMWYEGSSSYARTAAGYAIEGVDAMKDYRERRCYTDSDGIKLNGSLDADNRWKNFLSYVRNLETNAKIYFPDGSPIALNDTAWQKVSVNLEDVDNEKKYTKENSGNIELNHFGLYGLRHGDLSETQQLNINAQPVTGVSHGHSAPLGISYYSGGVELLPDIGYVPTSDVRYAKIVVSAHNTAFASEIENPAYSPAEGGSFFIRPNVLAYDDGSSSENKIQLIEGSNLMHSSNEVDINRRALMMIETEGNLSYLVDIHRIKGAEARETYLLQTEEEAVDFETSLNLPETGAGAEVTLPDWLNNTMNKKDGYVAKNAYSSTNEIRTAALKNPRGLKTNDDFWFTWKGKTTGTTLKAFVKGNDDSIVAFSQWPTSRILKEQETSHNGYHLYRSHNTTKDKVTTFGAVYEGYKENAGGKVSEVTWQDSADGNDMTTMLKVKLELTDGIYYDYIYISNDSTKRAFENFTFKGNYAMVRTNESGEVVRSYIYGAGEIKMGESVVNAGGKTLSYNVVSASGTRVKDNSIANKLGVSEVPAENLVGFWGNVTFSDGSGTAFKVEGVDKTSNEILIHNNPGFKMTENGAEFTAYPMYEDAEEPGKIGEFASAYPSGEKKARTAQGEVIFTAKTPCFVAID